MERISSMKKVLSFGFFPVSHPLNKAQNKYVQKLFTRILHEKKVVKICSPVHDDTF